MSSSLVEARRLRLIAAMLLAVSSMGVGFMAGWFSARLAHDDGAISRHVESSSRAPADPTKGSIAQPSRNIAVPKNTERADGKGQAASAPEPAKITESDNSQQPEQKAEIVTSGEEQAQDPATHGARLVNPGAGGVNSAAAAARSLTVSDETKSTLPEDLLDQCARRYASFRRSDGTYQPLDGGPRKRCALLR